MGTDLATARALVRAASFSIVSNTLLVVAKTVVGLMTGSLSVLSEALHSGSDLLAAMIAFGAVKASSQPADKGHPFGHGKYESISATVEGLILLAAAVWIAVEAIARLQVPGADHVVAMPGAIVMGCGVLLNTAVSIYLLKVAKRHNSPALHADGVHLRADVWTSAVVLAGLLAIHLGAPHHVDTVLALLVAAVVAMEGFLLVSNAAKDLVDAAVPEAERAVIERVLDECGGACYLAHHRLRTRRAGRGRQADVHIDVCQKLTVGEAHEISERLQQAVAEALPGMDLTVHIEPCFSEECLERLKQGIEFECPRQNPPSVETRKPERGDER